MLYQLPNGKVIDLDVEDILNMTKETMQLLLASNSGIHINHPFYQSYSADFSEDSDNDDDPETYYRDYFPDEYDNDEDPPELNTDII